MHAKIGRNSIRTECMSIEVLSIAARWRFDQIRWITTACFFAEAMQKLTRRTLTRNNKIDCFFEAGRTIKKVIVKKNQ